MSLLFGPLRQMGYVVRDIEGAMRHWIDVCGVGPWFYAERLPLTAFSYRGGPGLRRRSTHPPSVADLTRRASEPRFRRAAGASAGDLFVDAAAVANGEDPDHTLAPVDGVHQPIASHPELPQPFQLTPQWLAGRGLDRRWHEGRP